MAEAKITEQLIEKMKLLAGSRAMERAQAAKWDIDIAAFYFAILILIIILVYQGIGIGIVATAAVIGIATGWLIGRKKGQQKYHRFYDEELLKLELELKDTATRIANRTSDEQTPKKKRKKKSVKKNAGTGAS